jgi:hypothetical protein
MGVRSYVSAGLVATVCAIPLIAVKTTPCVATFDKCPDRGCAPAKSNHALLNITKHQRPTAGVDPMHIDFALFEQLQDAVPDAFPMGRGTDLSASQRKKVRTLKTLNGVDVGEGTFVQFEGFITDDPKNPRFNKGESVNCNFTEPEHNDIHINVVADPDDTEFDGIVVEMLPFDRPDDWNVPNLRLVRKAHRLVLIQGVLFYDNVHRPRTDPDAASGGNPARVSLFEVHPVTDFRVCMREANDCDKTDLSKWVEMDSLDKVKLKELAKE